LAECLLDTLSAKERIQVAWSMGFVNAASVEDAILRLGVDASGLDAIRTADLLQRMDQENLLQIPLDRSKLRPHASTNPNIQLHKGRETGLFNFMKLLAKFAFSSQLEAQPSQMVGVDKAQGAAFEVQGFWPKKVVSLAVFFGMLFVVDFWALNPFLALQPVALIGLLGVILAELILVITWSLLMSRYGSVRGSLKFFGSFFLILTLIGVCAASWGSTAVIVGGVLMAVAWALHMKIGGPAKGTQEFFNTMPIMVVIFLTMIIVTATSALLSPHFDRYLATQRGGAFDNKTFEEIYNMFRAGPARIATLGLIIVVAAIWIHWTPALIFSGVFLAVPVIFFITTNILFNHGATPVDCGGVVYAKCLYVNCLSYCCHLFDLAFRPSRDAHDFKEPLCGIRFRSCGVPGDIKRPVYGILLIGYMLHSITFAILGGGVLLTQAFLGIALLLTVRPLQVVFEEKIQTKTLREVERRKRAWLTRRTARPARPFEAPVARKYQPELPAAQRPGDGPPQFQEAAHEDCR
jgi:hypothetical protein